MSESNTPAPRPTDLLPEHHAALAQYQSEGLPGIGRIQESTVFQWFNLYLAGKTYEEIAKATSSSIAPILYMSNKYGWFERKMSHYNGIVAKLDSRVQAVKLESAEFVLDVITMIHRAHGGKINEFLQTGNRDLLKEVNLGVLDKYFKSLEALGKLMSNPPKVPEQPVPSVVVNVGDEASIKKNEDGSIEITAKSSLRDIAKKKKTEGPDNK
jgi:hypothetical protein